MLGEKKEERIWRLNNIHMNKHKLNRKINSETTIHIVKHEQWAKTNIQTKKNENGTRRRSGKENEKEKKIIGNAPNIE